MAQYKLIQDIEAEDKILGPLTLRQFLFGLAAAFMFYLSFIVTVKHVAFLLVVFLPPALFFAFFAFPFGRDQPTEIWFLAKLRFWFKPRKRVWNQSGVKELVTITVPKKIERVLTNGLSQTEVKSRLRALADTIDSRGWAVKNVSSNVYQSPLTATGSDRLLDIGSLPQEVSGSEVVPADDILDEANNPIARQFGAMIDQSSRNRRQQLIEQLNDMRQAEAAKQGGGADNAWFTGSTSTKTGAGTADDNADDGALSASLAAKTSSGKTSFGNLRTVRPLNNLRAASSQPGTAAAPAKQPGPMTTPDDPAILSLAKNNDLNVATLAREARKNKGDDEVVISLH
ncbi:MAG TPA: PrgI family protein [Candidatus Dormibacteraeota bacterium]|nr:PrgI family protein [Candidatus Dormibacteraeota bacterium]